MQRTSLSLLCVLLAGTVISVSALFWSAACHTRIGSSQVGIRRKAPAEKHLPARPNHSRQREAVGPRLDLRHRRGRRDADAATCCWQRDGGYTPTHKTFAVNAATGAELWVFDSGIKGNGPNRGLMYWSSGNEQRVFAAVDNFIYALDPAIANRLTASEKEGGSNLRENFGRDPQLQNVRLTSPGAIYQDIMIVGGRLGESLPTSPGDVRAYERPDGRAALVLPYDPAPRKTWVQNLAQGGVAMQWRGEQLAGDGPRRAKRIGVRSHGIGCVRLLWCRSTRRQPVCQLASRARRGDLQNASGTFSSSVMICGIAISRRRPRW